MEGLSLQDWKRLIQIIRRGSCILILGPNVAATPGSIEEDSLTECLVRSIGSQIGEKGVSEVGSLCHAAQRYVQHPPFSRPDLEDLVCDFHQPFQQETTPLHLALAQLPFTLCVNATFDRFLLNAFRSVGKHPVYDYYHFKSLEHRSPLSQIDPAILRDPQRPVVYNLYGSCEDAKSLVMSENDLLEFLVNVVKREPPLPDFVRARFSDSDASFLFLGFGFRHWYMRILLHVLQAHSHQHPSLAMEDARFFSHPERDELVVFFEREHRILFRHEGWSDFAVELLKRYEETEKLLQQGEPPPPPPGAPAVFLCHCSRDKARVEDLGKDLRARGINIWLDRQNLQGGDDWERLIPSVIKTQVDYVLVVQSEAMATLKESYFHAEIKAALERQKNFAEGVRFLIPAQLQTGCLLNELKHLQSVDLSQPDAVLKLSQTILEDWSRSDRRRRNP